MPSLPSETPLPHAASRRALMKSAAWSVPAITVVAATPAYARSTTPTVTFDVDDFGGERVLITPRSFVVNDIRIHNTGSEPLEAGQLVVTIESPAEWGNATGEWDTTRAAQTLPNTTWDVSFNGRVATFTSLAGANPIPVGGVLDPLPIGLDWAWTLDGTGGTTGTKTIEITVSAVSQQGVQAARFIRAFTGNSWLSTLPVDRVQY